MLGIYIGGNETGGHRYHKEFPYISSIFVTFCLPWYPYTPCARRLNYRGELHCQSQGPFDWMHGILRTLVNGYVDVLLIKSDVNVPAAAVTQPVVSILSVSVIPGAFDLIH